MSQNSSVRQLQQQLHGCCEGSSPYTDEAAHHHYINYVHSLVSSGSRGGGAEGAMPPPPGPVKISHKKDGRQIRLHGFHVSRPPYLAAGSATAGRQSEIESKINKNVFQ